MDSTIHKHLLGTFITDLILQVLAYVTATEKIKKRQAEIIAAAKLQGKHPVRPKTNTPENLIQFMKNGFIKRFLLELK
ncbi:MAG: hypothetical protein ACYDG2_22875 [Ruminiclostridium sp.]